MHKITFMKTIGVVEALKMAKARGYEDFEFHANFYPPQQEDWEFLEDKCDEMMALIKELKVKMVERRMYGRLRTRKDGHVEREVDAAAQKAAEIDQNQQRIANLMIGGNDGNNNTKMD
ncbi:Oidioi.mRNA.OKI2018_I69.XSR.g14815.t1.cds [Oikopleura dioica]|uniref:Oidioi.mRNA.OKI2018_I69.XSR.g14815.t1.cds n=1 Tax=Oikopleura dioica TaxID=34765 RepID=A0ABN7SEX7_OIKDI|nr:Oidioi.mRNA.OKI2018_I69.XSR.g14815.t1.cds [Oikopleura dioica]